MERFVRRENIRRYRDLLQRATDPRERGRIERLLADEQRKQRDAGDETEDERR
jgi:hypothetical protein